MSHFQNSSRTQLDNAVKKKSDHDQIIDASRPRISPRIWGSLIQHSLLTGHGALSTSIMP
jgi:hypothetical protein